MNYLPRHSWIIVWLLVAAAGCGVQLNAQPMAHSAVLVQPAGQNTGPAYLFVANRYVNTVFRIDLATQKFHGIIVGGHPHNLAARPDGSQVAVCNESGGGISIIDVETLKVRTVATGANPVDVRYSPDGRWLAVANYAAQTIAVVDPATFETWSVWVGGGPASVSFDSRSQTVAAACFKDNDVKLVDVASQEVVATWDLDPYEPQEEFLQPQVIAFGPPLSDYADTMFVGLATTVVNESPPIDLTYAHSIAVIPFPPQFYDDPTIRPSDVQVVRAGPSPSGFLWNQESSSFLAFNHDYLAEPGEGDTVSQLQPSSGVWFEQRRFVVGRNPAGAARAPGRDYAAVANHDSHSISLIDLATRGQTTVDVPDNPYAVAFSPSGRYLFVVHETPLMPVTLVDTQAGTSWNLYKSLSMSRWIQ